MKMNGPEMEPLCHELQLKEIIRETRDGTYRSSSAAMALAADRWEQQMRIQHVPQAKERQAEPKQPGPGRQFGSSPKIDLKSSAKAEHILSFAVSFEIRPFLKPRSW